MSASLDRQLIATLPEAKQVLLDQVDTLHGAIAESAEAGDWSRTAELERERAAVLREAYQALDQLSPEEGEALARLTQALIASDRALVEHVAREKNRLEAELGSLRRGQKAVGAYTRHTDR